VSAPTSPAPDGDAPRAGADRVRFVRQGAFSQTNARLLAALRRQRIIARIQDDTAVLDPRTLLDPADDRLLAGLVAALAKP
jgi:hypothetical protein